MICDRLLIRRSVSADLPRIVEIHADAFGRRDEAALACELIAAPHGAISLVAQCEERIVGHVVLSEVGAPVKSAALAPLAVLASHRDMQIGSGLVRASIHAAREAGYRAIFVLGDAGYYERFGFLSAAADPFEIAWQGPHFMALELAEGALAGKSGKLNYPRAFFEI